MEISANVLDVWEKSPKKDWLRQFIPRELGSCYAEFLELDKGLNLVHSRYTPNCDLAENSKQINDAKMLTITIGLKGTSEFRDDHDRSVYFKPARTIVTVYKNIIGKRLYEADKSIAQFRLVMSENYIKRFLSAKQMKVIFGAPESLTVLLNEQTTAISRNLANRLLSNHITQMDKQICGLTLLSEFLKKLVGEEVQEHVSDAQFYKLQEVVDIMEREMSHGLTIGYLCCQTGLNEFTLKQGFKKQFGTSPYKYLFDLRMKRAHILLETGLQVAQVAWEVGYKHPNNFSTAFLKYFNYQPKYVSGK